MTPETALLLADLILALHWTFAAFIGLGLAVIWFGRCLGWGFIRSRPLRLTHLGAMGVVLAESLLGVFCPLTEWEYQLRRLAGQSGRYETTFMDYWAQKLLYWDLPAGLFLFSYALFFGLMLATWWLVPPNPRTRR
ncbi:MAG: DUF2784 domain-containing protein [Proteobacteria bacterium]|nr:DUF2784 domain-containing protein [Pseudomonadota bacterium]